MIENRLMAAGGWDVNLRPGTPSWLLDQIDDGAFFGHLIVTPSRVDPNAMSDATLRGLSRYTGVYRSRSDDGLALSGAGLAIWLGDEDDKGKQTTAAINASDSFGSWANALFGIGGTYQLGNGIVTFGTVEALAGTYRLKHPPLVTGRVLLDDLCLQADAEWKITDNVISMGSVGWLFPTTAAPTTVILRQGGSAGLGLRGLPVTSWGDQIDAEDYATGVLVPYAGDTNYAADRITPPYLRLDGDEIEIERVVDGDKIANAINAANLAARERAKTDDVRVEISPTVDVWDIGETVQPGDTIYLYEPRLGLIDTTTQVSYRGETIFPTTKRVYATKQPIRQGMGVYIRLPDATGTIVDLTDWVASEDGDCTLEVGAPRRSLLREQRRGAA